MASIYLSSTKLEVEAPEGYHHHDDGLVKSVVSHTNMLKKRYGVNAILDPGYIQILEATIPNLYKQILQTKQWPFVKGRTLVYGPKLDRSIENFREGGEIHCHTYVLDMFPEMETTFFRGHEETHVLFHLNQLSALQTALKQVNVNAQTLEALPEEAICQVGGFYALIRNYPGSTYHLKGVQDSYFDIWSKWLAENSTWKLS